MRDFDYFAADARVADLATLMARTDVPQCVRDRLQQWQSALRRRRA
jgi:hypothetical protein